MKSSKLSRAWLWPILLMTCLLVAAPAIPVFAIEYGSGLYGACQYGSCSITIGSNSNVSVNVTPNSGGSCTVQSDSVSVLTSNSSGYTLTLADSGTNTALRKGSDSIAATSATQASPSALSANAWGYRVDGAGAFGNGPTTAGNNTSPGSTTFAGVPASNGTAATVASTSVAANPAVTTTIWYGVCANTNIPNGTYTTQVVYTAVTN